jgi:hypothetical protein
VQKKNSRARNVSIENSGEQICLWVEENCVFTEKFLCLLPPLMVDLETNTVTFLIYITGMHDGDEIFLRNEG